MAFAVRRRTLSISIRMLATIALLAAGACVPVWAAGEDWNDAQIKWLSYEEGLAAAQKDSKPICLIFYTTWCPHCGNYAKVFRDPKVADKAKSFVMVRVDKDKNQDLSKKFKPDGEYIPRTYFLSSKGELDESLTENRPQYKYFYSENDPSSILAGMDRALKKLR